MAQYPTARNTLDRTSRPTVLLTALILAAAFATAAETQVSFTKTFGPDTIFEGNTSTLTLTISTGEGSPVSGFTFTDTLPAGVVIATPSNASASAGCLDAVLSAPDGGSVISLSDTEVYTVEGEDCVVTVDVTSAAAGTYVNVTGELTSDDPSSPHGTASDTLTIEPPPGFSKAFGPDTILEGGVSTLTFTIDNSAATTTAHSLAFSDTLPAGVVIATPPNGSQSGCGEGGMLSASAGGSVISWAGGFVDPGSTCTVSVDVTAATAGTYDNLSGDLTSSGGSSGTAADTLTVQAISDVGFSKAFLPDTIGPGSTTELRFDIDNSESPTSRSPTCCPPGSLSPIRRAPSPTAPTAFSASATTPTASASPALSSALSASASSPSTSSAPRRRPTPRAT